ncbi:MAG: HAD-IIB family hydrolase [Chloroflexi bacterium]|nr:HAD-IIB family hydrolase [Chloroflexota bacterium]
MNLPDFSATVPKAIAMDLDETMLNSRGRLDERARVALHAVHRVGMPMIIATSRPERVLPTLVGDDVLEITSLVQMNGTVALGNAGLIGAIKHSMNLEDAQICWNLTNEHAPLARMTLEIDGTRFAVNHDDDIDELWAFNTATPTMVVPFDKALRSGPVKVSINGMGHNLEALAIMLENRLSSQTVIFRAGRAQFLNIVPAQASKSGAVADLLKSVGISLTDVLSFGDDFVDIDLIRDCGWSVAVENAIPEIKSLAKYHTASNDNHGVAIVLEHLVTALT